MAYPGKAISNPITGERGVFLQTSETTNGQLLEMDGFIAPKGFVSIEHIHRAMNERFEIVKGPIHMKIDGKEQIVGTGEIRMVPKGTSHIWWNPSDQEVQVRLQYRPAGKIEFLFENVSGLAQKGQVNKKNGLPYFLQLMVFGNYYFDSMCAANPPQFLQRILLAMFAPVGWVFGYRAKYPEYTN